MKKTLFSLMLSVLPYYATAAIMQEGPANPSNIRVVRMDPSPEGNQVSSSVIFPKDWELKKDQPVKLEIKLYGFPLGLDTDLPRSNEIYNMRSGQALRVFIDNYEPFDLREALFDNLDPHDVYFEQTVEDNIPFDLKPGMHVIRAIPVRSFNETLKGDKAAAVSVFYCKTKQDNPQMDVKKPFLTYNYPLGAFNKNKPILLDFYINNCSLSRDGYKVRLTIDESNKRFLYEWVPYYIYGLDKGDHTIRLELLDPQNNLVPGDFNNISRTITVK